MAARDQCPSGMVRQVAEAALEAIAQHKPGALREQAYLVLTASQGWRGDRANQVRASLSTFLNSAAEDAVAEETTSEAQPPGAQTPAKRHP